MTEHHRTRGPRPPDAAIDRRRFVRGLACAGALTGLGLQRLSFADAAGDSAQPTNHTEFVVAQTPVNITGRPRLATTLNGSLPAPLLRWREGDTVGIRVINRLKESTSIHWHGLTVPAAMDGVPGLTFPGIGAGETFDYRFALRQSGTYWYHSHSGHQEQAGFYGPIIIEPAAPEPFGYDRDYVVMLSDWTDEDPASLLRNLKIESDYYNFRQRTLGDLFRDARSDGWRATLADRKAFGEMRMNPSDLADVGGWTYTYLLNGQPPAANWTGLFRPGERVRLRFINAGAMTFFDVRIPGLPMTVVAADGQYLRPVTVDELRLGNAECYDVIVTPADDTAYTIFAQSMDRTGYARGTLAPREGMAAAVPPLDPRPVLTMADMGHGAHAGHVMAPAAADPHAGHRMPGMAGGADADHENGAAAAQSAAVTHAPAEYGPGVDMRVDTPTQSLADPGIGLRNNGRRVLTYADLESRFPDPDGREPGRTLELHLTGHMGRYVWSFNGVKASDAEPLHLRLGERLRVVLINDTMMEHPIHLHGMWSDLEDESGHFKVRKHTINVKPAQRVSFRVTADAPGRWALHCHLMLHMAAGMFREVRVSGAVPGTAQEAGHEHG
jgi:CopA family copper-resistance protein